MPKEEDIAKNTRPKYRDKMRGENSITTSISVDALPFLHQTPAVALSIFSP